MKNYVYYYTIYNLFIYKPIKSYSLEAPNDSFSRINHRPNGSFRLLIE